MGLFGKIIFDMLKDDLIGYAFVKTDKTIEKALNSDNDNIVKKLSRFSEKVYSKREKKKAESIAKEEAKFNKFKDEMLKLYRYDKHLWMSEYDYVSYNGERYFKKYAFYDDNENLMLYTNQISNSNKQKVIIYDSNNKEVASIKEKSNLFKKTPMMGYKISVSFDIKVNGSDYGMLQFGTYKSKEVMVFDKLMWNISHVTSRHYIIESLQESKVAEVITKSFSRFNASYVGYDYNDDILISVLTIAIRSYDMVVLRKSFHVERYD